MLERRHRRSRALRTLEMLGPAALSRAGGPSVRACQGWQGGLSGVQELKTEDFHSPVRGGRGGGSLLGPPRPPPADIAAVGDPRIHKTIYIPDTPDKASVRAGFGCQGLTPGASEPLTPLTGPPWTDLDTWRRALREARGVDEMRAVVAAWARAAGGEASPGAVALPAGLRPCLTLAELRGAAERVGLCVERDAAADVIRRAGNAFSPEALADEAETTIRGKIG
jgi:hypothetical protein